MTSYSFTAWGKPAVKQRPRMTRSGRTYTPAATIEAEKNLAAQYAGPLFEGPVALAVEYHKDHQIVTIHDLASWANESKLRGDLDNYLKLTSDALNGVAWTDDRLVKRIFGDKL